MKLVKFSPVSLAISLVLGVMALWVGATPIGTSGDLATGGWVSCYLYSEGVRVAATQGSCDPCRGTLVRYCYEYYGGACSGGSITVVVSGGPGATPHVGGSPPCGYPCTDIYSGACY
jgi:hypothetical protein